MKILIVEDEEPAAIRLKKLIEEIEPEAIILDMLASVDKTEEWLKNHVAPDLIMLDINLADGLSFELFSKVKIESPVIFITAYDEYAVKAFKVNSIDYLLKPVKKEELVNAINKYKKQHLKKNEIPDLSEFFETIKERKTLNKRRFLIRYGDHIKAIDAEDAAYFYTEEKINFIKTKDNHTYTIDYNLDKLEEMLDPEKFFRINRQFIISYNSISEMFSYSKSRVKVVLKPPINLDTIVSTERSPLFKEWLTGKE